MESYAVLAVTTNKEIIEGLTPTPKKTSRKPKKKSRRANNCDLTFTSSDNDLDENCALRHKRKEDQAQKASVLRETSILYQEGEDSRIRAPTRTVTVTAATTLTAAPTTKAASTMTTGKGKFILLLL